MKAAKDMCKEYPVLYFDSKGYLIREPPNVLKRALNYAFNYPVFETASASHNI